MKKITILFFTLLGLAYTSMAQDTNGHKSQIEHKNYIGAQAGLFTVKNKFSDFPIIRTIGLNYYRQLYGHFSVDVTYMMWLPSTFGNEFNWVQEIPDGTPYKVGELVVSEDFKMIDVSALYSFLSTTRNHSLNIGCGITRYWGYNYHIKYLSYFHPGSYEKDKRVAEAFWGICPQLSYRYSFLHNRISVGFTYKYRHIFHPKMNTESNYLITAGYNF